jgi:hypothetical protein
MFDWQELMGRVWGECTAIWPNTGTKRNNYAFIAAISGAMPRIFMTRLRL